MKILKLRHANRPGTLRLRVRADHIVSYIDHDLGGTSLLIFGEDQPIRVLDTPDEIDAMLGVTDSAINDRMTPDSAYRIRQAAHVAKHKADYLDRDCALAGTPQRRTPYHDIAELLAPWATKEGA